MITRNIIILLTKIKLDYTTSILLGVNYHDKDLVTLYLL